MSDQLCTELEQRKCNQIKDKRRYGERYEDHNLIFCYPNGRPIDPRRLSDKFMKWQTNNSIEDVDSVVFHSIRITSTSLKLVVSGGDIKSAQKDLGDKTTHMVLSTYARSLDTQHTAMNRKFDEFFYGNKDSNATSTTNEQLSILLSECVNRPDFFEKFVGAFKVNL